MKILLLLASFLIVSCAHEKSKNQETQPSDAPFKIFDAHTHFPTLKDGSLSQPSPEMLKEFEEAGVVSAVVHLEGKEHKGFKLDRTKAKQKLVICAAIKPGEITPLEVEKGIKDGLFQCMKIYLGYVPKYPADPFYTPYYKLAEKMKVPVVFHTGDTYDKMAKVKFADPLGVDEVAVTYPKVTFVIAHLGNPWFQSAAEVLYKNDNVFADLSAIVIGDLSSMSNETVDALVIQPIHWIWEYVGKPNKFMYGSDYPLTKIKPYAELIKKAIPKEHWNAVFYQNAATLFLKEPATKN